MTRNVAPALQSGELLSSWLVRYALASGCDPLSLTGTLWRGARPWTRDLDRGLPETMLVALAERFDFATDALRDALLTRHVPRTGIRLERPVWPWILPVGARNRLRHGGLQFCPRCLAEDRIPYYRVRWRLAWVTCCDVHGVTLLDCCAKCQAPAEPHRLAGIDHSLTICATCKASLALQHACEALPEARTFQAIAQHVAASGHGAFGSLSMEGSEWFAMARHMSVLLRRASSAKPDWSLHRLSSDLGLSDIARFRSSTGLALELLGTQDRSDLLAGVAQLISVGVDRFVDAVQTAGVTLRVLSSGNRNPPAALMTRLAISHSTDAVRHRTKQRRRTTAPRSPASVRQSWLRLQRRMAAELR